MEAAKSAPDGEAGKKNDHLEFAKWSDTSPNNGLNGSATAPPNFSASDMYSSGVPAVTVYAKLWGAKIAPAGEAKRFI